MMNISNKAMIKNRSTVVNRMNTASNWNTDRKQNSTNMDTKSRIQNDLKINCYRKPHKKKATFKTTNKNFTMRILQKSQQVN